MFDKYEKALVLYDNCAAVGFEKIKYSFTSSNLFNLLSFMSLILFLLEIILTGISFL